jgi:hypothetical protein
MENILLHEINNHNSCWNPTQQSLRCQSLCIGRFLAALKIFKGKIVMVGMPNDNRGPMNAGKSPTLIQLANQRSNSWVPESLAFFV